MANYTLIGKVDNGFYLNEFKGAPPIEYSKYITQVNNQRKLNPSFPKLDDLLPFTSTNALKLEDAIENIASDSFEYIGTKTLNRVVVWEFCQRATSFEASKFLYIPAEQSNVTSRIPSLVTTSGITQTTSYPLTPNLFFFNAEVLNRYYSLEVGDLSHPFLPFFYFSGKAFLLNNQIYYEYFDNEGLYGPKYQVYLSSLRPFYLDFPLGLPDRVDIFSKDCFLTDIPKKPLAYLPWEEGEFTGYIYYLPVQVYSSNNNFISTGKDQVQYIYVRPNNIIFSLPSPPT